MFTTSTLTRNLLTLYSWRTIRTATARAGGSTKSLMIPSKTVRKKANNFRKKDDFVVIYDFFADFYVIQCDIMCNTDHGECDDGECVCDDGYDGPWCGKY